MVHELPFISSLVVLVYADTEAGQNEDILLCFLLNAATGIPR